MVETLSDTESKRIKNTKNKHPEFTFDPQALTFDQKQVETVSFCPVCPETWGVTAPTQCPLEKYYHFAEDHSDEHGVAFM